MEAPPFVPAAADASDVEQPLEPLDHPGVNEKEGKLKIFETRKKGIEEFPAALQGLFSGSTIAKSMVEKSNDQVAREDHAEEPLVVIEGTFSPTCSFLDGKSEKGVGQVLGEEEQGVRGGERVGVQPDEPGDEGHSLSILRQAQDSTREGQLGEQWVSSPPPSCRIVECPQGHPLHRADADVLFRCDVCAICIYEGHAMMYCEGCDYSMCWLCHGRPASLPFGGRTFTPARSDYGPSYVEWMTRRREGNLDEG